MNKQKKRKIETIKSPEGKQQQRTKFEEIIDYSWKKLFRHSNSFEMNEQLIRGLKKRMFINNLFIWIWSKNELKNFKIKIDTYHLKFLVIRFLKKIYLKKIETRNAQKNKKIDIEKTWIVWSKQKTPNAKI